MQQRSTAASHRPLPATDTNDTSLEASNDKFHSSNNNNTHSGNQNLFRVLILLLVFASFLVMYSIVRESPAHDLPNYNDAVKKRKEMDKRNKAAAKQRRKNAVDAGETAHPDEHEEAAPTEHIPEKPRNVKGADVPESRGRAFDEKHIDLVKKMIMIGRDMKYPDQGIHPFHDVHEDNLDDAIRNHKNDHDDAR